MLCHNTLPSRSRPFTGRDLSAWSSFSEMQEVCGSRYLLTQTVKPEDVAGYNAAASTIMLAQEQGKCPLTSTCMAAKIPFAAAKGTTRRLRADWRPRRRPRCVGCLLVKCQRRSLSGELCWAAANGRNGYAIRGLRSCMNQSMMFNARYTKLYCRCM